MDNMHISTCSVLKKTRATLKWLLPSIAKLDLRSRSKLNCQQGPALLLCALLLLTTIMGETFLKHVQQRECFSQHANTSHGTIDFKQKSHPLWKKTQKNLNYLDRDTCT